MNGLCFCSHKHQRYAGRRPSSSQRATYLLVCDRERALGLLVGAGILLRPPHGVVLQHRRGEEEVAPGVLVAGVDHGVVRERGQRPVERPVHLLGGALEELAAAGVEERVAGEDGPLVAVLQQPADAVLRVAGRVQGLDGDAAHLPGLAVGGRPGHTLRVLAGDDGQAWQAEDALHLVVTA